MFTDSLSVILVFYTTTLDLATILTVDFAFHGPRVEASQSIEHLAIVQDDALERYETYASILVATLVLTFIYTLNGVYRRSCAVFQIGF